MQSLLRTSAFTTSSVSQFVFCRLMSAPWCAHLVHFLTRTHVELIKRFLRGWRVESIKAGKQEECVNTTLEDLTVITCTYWGSVDVYINIYMEAWRSVVKAMRLKGRDRSHKLGVAWCWSVVEFWLLWWVSACSLKFTLFIFGPNYLVLSLGWSQGQVFKR